MAVLAKLTTFDMSRAQRRAIQDLGASPDELAKSIYGWVDGRTAATSDVGWGEGWG